MTKVRMPRAQGCWWKAALVVSVLAASAACSDGKPQDGEVYDPMIDPALFTHEISHPLFPYAAGRTWNYTEGAEGTVDIEVLTETKTVFGVQCAIVHDVAKVDGVIEEDTYDWYAQDTEGNVWYFGEDTKELDAQGNVITTAGSWEAGVDGAKPGIIMPADAHVGDIWREEYLAGEAEDMAKALSLNAGIAVPAGSFTGCLKTFNFTPLDPTSNEIKIYCPEVGPVHAIDLLNDEVEQLITHSP